MKKNFWVLLCLLIVCMLRGDSVYASESMYNFSVVADDPQAEREKGVILDGFYDDAAGEDDAEEDPYGIAVFSLPYGYTHNSKYANYTVINGIDVSYYQGNIDWNAVKADGIDFAIIRVGYRGYGTSGNMKEDARYVQNIQGALNAGVKVGVYIFSQATTTAEAVEEADFLLSRIGGYNITFPVVLDYEYASVNGSVGGRLYDAHLSRREATEVCKAFSARVASAGYRPMIYANKSMLRNQLYASELSASYDIWLANYTYQTDYEGDYTCWQYTSDGNVSGISGRVDMDFWYDKPSTVYQGVDYAAVYNYDYFIAKYSDVYAQYAGDRAGALKYFVEYGMDAGLQGNEEFNVYAYKNRYVDLRNYYGEDLSGYYMHYIQAGKAEGRDATGNPALTGKVTVYKGVDYSAVYDFDYYMNAYSDLQAVFANDDIAAIRHFVENGMSEGRQGNAEFNVFTYRNRYADLRVGYRNDLKGYYMHYIQSGKAEGRSGAGTAEFVPMTVYQGVDYAAVYNYDYYMNKYPDLASAFGNDDYGALQHFVEDGMAEGRQGSEEFNVYTYKNRYTDLRRGFRDNLPGYYLHYINNGKAEGRSGAGDATFVGDTVYQGVDYAAVYNFDYYMNKYPDLASVFGNDEYGALQHFVEHGMSEGRQGSSEFDVYAYMSRYPDLKAGFGDYLLGYYLHYMNNGKAEGRSGAPLTEEELNQGKYNEADYAAVYDFDTYVSLYPDIATGFKMDRAATLEHFVEHGMAEGRQGSEEFNVYAYMNRYPDLKAGFGDNLLGYYLHYINNGKAEGRNARVEEVASLSLETALETEAETENAEINNGTPETVEGEGVSEDETLLESENAPEDETLLEGENMLEGETALAGEAETEGKPEPAETIDETTLLE